MKAEPSLDPRAVRTREALQDAFKELLRTKSLQKISVSEITDQAGIARHTFYNHYQTKADLFNTMIDSILDDFFLSLGSFNLYFVDPIQEQAMLTGFFQAWKDHAETVRLLTSVNIEIILIDRLKAFFSRFYLERISREMPEVDPELASYFISFNAYSLLGILIPWFESGMKHKPEDLAGFYLQLSESSQRRKAIENYKNIFRNKNP